MTRSEAAPGTGHYINWTKMLSTAIGALGGLASLVAAAAQSTSTVEADLAAVDAATVETAAENPAPPTDGATPDGTPTADGTSGPVAAHGGEPKDPEAKPDDGKPDPKAPPPKPVRSELSLSELEEILRSTNPEHELRHADGTPITPDQLAALLRVSTADRTVRDAAVEQARAAEQQNTDSKIQHVTNGLSQAAGGIGGVVDEKHERDSQHRRLAFGRSDLEWQLQSGHYANIRSSTRRS